MIIFSVIFGLESTSDRHYVCPFDLYELWGSQTAKSCYAETFISYISLFRLMLLIFLAIEHVKVSYICSSFVFEI